VERGRHNRVVASAPKPKAQKRQRGRLGKSAAYVLLLLRNGMLALGECKRRPGGLVANDLAKLDVIADRVHAAWTFAATLGWADKATPLWETLRRELPERRRFALCAEQLFAPSIDVVALLGNDPTAWSPVSSDERAARHDRFKDRLPEATACLERPPTMAWRHFGQSAKPRKTGDLQVFLEG
jgi:hypothetical protein